MKKKIYMLLTAQVLSMSLLAGCGNSAQKADSGAVVVEEPQAEETPAAVETVQETAQSFETESEAAEETQTEQTEPETETEPEPADYLAEHGIMVTPQGDCQVTFLGYDENNEPVGDFSADVNVVISETTDGADEGFKKVSALFTIDVSNCTSAGWWSWLSAFDRYTGTSFEFDSTVTYTEPGEHKAKEGFVTIENGEEAYDVSIQSEMDNQYPIIYSTITVTCPVDYDGTVFQIGYGSPELSEKNQQIDYTARLYTIDELPFFGDGYLYFTMTDD